MIPLILAAVGGYLVTDSLNSKKFAKGGQTSELGYRTENKDILPEDILEAAKDDYAKQKSWDKSYDRKLGFISGAKWAFKMAGVKTFMVNR